MYYELAINYWDIKDQEAKKLNSETLNKLIDEFINLHNTCALATGFNDYIRCTPIEYNYFNDILFIEWIDITFIL